MDMSLSGLATGLDTSSIISQLMSIERRPQAMMKQRKAAAQTKLDRYRALNTKMLALQSAAKSLTATSLVLSPLSTKKATSSNTALFNASADTTAATGTYTLDIQQLAKEQKSGGGAYTPSNGTLRIADSTGAYKDITVSSAMTADDVAASINGAGAGMSATVIGGKLMLTGKQTGEVYTLTDTGGGGLVANLGLNATIQAAQQAKVVIDGTFTVTSKSNTITTALPGVTINAVATGTASLTVDRDSDAAIGKVKDFVAKFNDIINQIKEDTKYDATAKKGGVLLGDSFASNLQSQLNQMLTNPFQMYDPASGTYSSVSGFANYSDVGLSVQRDGTIALDETKLKAAMDKDPAKLYALFGQEDNASTTDSFGFSVQLNTNRDGIAKRLDAFVDAMVSSSSRYNFSADASGTRFAGPMANAIKTSEDLLKDFDKRIEAFDVRMVMREQQLKNQFLAMEKSVAMLRNQGNYLAGQFAQMSQQG